MSDFDKNGELHHNSSNALDPSLESVYEHILERQTDESRLTAGDPRETLVFPKSEMRDFRLRMRTKGMTPQNLASATAAMRMNLENNESSVDQQVEALYNENSVPLFLREIRKAGSDQELTEQIAKEKKEAKHVLQVLNERMRACEDWLLLLGDTSPTLKRRISGTAFFPMAATGLLRDFDALWNNFWNIRLRRGLPIPENPPDERLLNQASSHAFRCEHGNEDVEFLKTLRFRRQSAIEYYSHIEQFFQDPRNKDTDTLIAVFRDDSRYFRVRLPRQEWFEQTQKETAVREIEGIILGLEIQQATRVSPEMQRELKSATYGKHKETSQNPLLRTIFGHEANEQTMVFLEPENLVNKQTKKVKQLSDTVNDADFFTGEHVTRVVKPLMIVDAQTRKRIITATEVGVSHRFWDGVESHKGTIEATSGLANRYRYVEGESISNAIQIDPVEDVQLENGQLSRVQLTERFGQHTISLERYKEIREKLDQVRQLYEVPPKVKEELQSASSFTLPDIVQLACHSLGMEAGQMVVMQKNTTESLLDVAFSIANDDLLMLAEKVASGAATQEEQHTYTKALLGTSSRFIREKAWAMQGKGTASFFATLAGQKRLLEWVSKVLGGKVVGKRYVRGVNNQDYMISVPTNTTSLLEKSTVRSRVTSFYSAQTDSLAMDASTDRDGMGAIGVVDSPEQGLVLSLRTMPDQSWITIQETITQLFPVNEKNRKLVTDAYRELIFKGNNKPLVALQGVHAEQLVRINSEIEEAIQQKIDRQLQDLDKHLDVVLNALIKFAADHNKDKNNKFLIFSPNGELDGWQQQIQNDERNGTRGRGVRGALVGVWGSITGRRKE